MKAYLEERRSNADPFLSIPTYPDRPTTLQPTKLQAPQKRKARDVKKRNKNHRRQYKVRRIENPSTSAPRTAAATIITPTPPTTSNSMNLVVVTSMWPTTSTIMVNLFVPPKLPNAMGIPNTPKLQTSRSLPRPYTPAPFTDWSSDDNCNGTKQKEKKTLSKEENGKNWQRKTEREKKTILHHAYLMPLI